MTQPGPAISSSHGSFPQVSDQTLMPHKHTHRHARSERFEEFAVFSFNQAPQALLKETPAVVCWFTGHAGPLGTDPRPQPRRSGRLGQPLAPGANAGGPSYPRAAAPGQRPGANGLGCTVDELAPLSARPRPRLGPAPAAQDRPGHPAHPETQTGPGCEKAPARPQARDPPPLPAMRPSPPQGRAQWVTGPRGGMGAGAGPGRKCRWQALLPAVGDPLLLSPVLLSTHCARPRGSVSCGFYL